MRFPAAMSSPSNVGPMMSSPAPGKCLLMCVLMWNQLSSHIQELYDASHPPGILPPPLAAPFASIHPGSAPITPMSVGPEVIYSGKHNGICVYFARVLGSVCNDRYVASSYETKCGGLIFSPFLFLLTNRNIWDGSLAVENTISKGSQTFSIVSTISKLSSGLL